MGSGAQLWVVALCFFLPPAFGFAIFWATYNPPFADTIQSYGGLVAPYFVSIAILFALFASFLTNDIWVRGDDRATVLVRNVEHEAGALQSMRQIANALGDIGTEVQASVDDYIDAMVNEELPSRDGGLSVSINDALQRIADAILDPELSRADYAIVQAQLLESFREIMRARADRSPYSFPGIHLYKWTGMIILGLLTQISIAMIHMDNRKATAASLLLFTLAFMVTVGFLAISEYEITEIIADPSRIIKPIAQGLPWTGR